MFDQAGSNPADTLQRRPETIDAQATPRHYADSPRPTQGFLMADIVIFGAGQIAEVAKVYMDAHSDDRIVGFTVDAQYAKVDRFHGLPVVPWENLEEFFPPDQVCLLGPLSYRRVNEFRRARYLEGKRRNYRFASFIHPNSHVYSKEIGENCFMLEANVIQPFVKIGNNVMLWSNNHIGHHSTIGDHCFLAGRVGIAGDVHIGEGCFLGGKVGISGGLTIGDDCFLSFGVIVTKDLASGSVVLRGARDRVAAFPSSRMRGLF